MQLSDLIVYFALSFFSCKAGQGMREKARLWKKRGMGEFEVAAGDR